MTRRLRPIRLALGFSLALSSCVTASRPMLPPELQDEGSYLRGFSEPPLWPAQAAVGYRQRLRLYLQPMVRQQVVIRVDTQVSGRSAGYFIRLAPGDGPRGWRISEWRRFRVSAKAMAKLDQLIASSRVWSIYPEYWRLRKDAICIDGVEMIMERVTTQGYRFSEANAQCTAPASMLAIAAQMIDMADPGDRQVADWLR